MSDKSIIAVVKSEAELMATFNEIKKKMEKTGVFFDESFRSPCGPASHPMR